MTMPFKADTPRFCVRCGLEQDLVVRFDLEADGEVVGDYETEGPNACAGCGHSTHALHGDLGDFVRSDKGNRQLAREARGQMALVGPAD